MREHEDIPIFCAALGEAAASFHMPQEEPLLTAIAWRHPRT
jgi:hypothetical protein